MENQQEHKKIPNTPFTYPLRAGDRWFKACGIKFAKLE